jgi:hypothetical protein
MILTSRNSGPFFPPAKAKAFAEASAALLPEVAGDLKMPTFAGLELVEAAGDVARVQQRDRMEAVEPFLAATEKAGRPRSDVLTVRELFGAEQGRTLAFVGDGNNVARSLAVGCGKLGIKFVLACPKGYGFDPAFRADYVKGVNPQFPSEVNDPVAAVRGGPPLRGGPPIRRWRPPRSRSRIGGTASSAALFRRAHRDYASPAGACARRVSAL